MYGYIEVNGEQQSIMPFPEREIVNQFTSRLFKRYYPAFGQDPNKTIDIIIQKKGEFKQLLRPGGLIIQTIMTVYI
jgi:hypothetical protein